MFACGRKRVGMNLEEKSVMVKQRIRRRAELNRDKSRMKILENRKRYKIKVEKNEELMRMRKKHGEKLGPTCVSLMQSREKEKQRHSAIGSLVPLKPKFSQIKNHPLRIYGKRFELIEK